MNITHVEQLDVLKEPGADRDEGLLGPLVEPVDGRAVGHGRELAAPHTQRRPHRGEAEDHL